MSATYIVVAPLSVTVLRGVRQGVTIAQLNNPNSCVFILLHQLSNLSLSEEIAMLSIALIECSTLVKIVVYSSAMTFYTNLD